MISEERKLARPAERVEIGEEGLMSVKGRSAMYPLPLKGRYGRSFDLVLEINEDFAILNPAGTASGAANGFLILLVVLLSITMLLFGNWIFLAIIGEGSGDWFITTVCVLGFLLFGTGNVAVIKSLRRQVVGFPLLALRKERKVVQLQGSARVEADWERLRPYIEPVTSVSSVGASTSCNVHLIEPTEDGRNARRQILLQNALGLYDCLATYEFLARYMEGDWEGLPDIHLIPGVRPKFWDAYRYGFFNGWIGVPRWDERSEASRRWMWLLTPLWTAIFWPLVILTIAGTRTGRVLRFDQSEIGKARDAIAEPMPASLQDKIKAPSRLQPAEKLLYWLSMMFGGVLWGAIALKSVMLILGADSAVVAIN